MDLTTYGFENAVGAFFEMPTSDARKILPDPPPAARGPASAKHPSGNGLPVHRKHGRSLRRSRALGNRPSDDRSVPATSQGGVLSLPGRGDNGIFPTARDRTMALAALHDRPPNGVRANRRGTGDQRPRRIGARPRCCGDPLPPPSRRESSSTPSR